MHEFVARTLVADRHDRLIAEAEAHRIGRVDVAKNRRPSFVLRLVRRLANARRAAPVTVSVASASTPKITAPTT